VNGLKKWLRDIYLSYLTKNYKGGSVAKIDMHVHYVPKAYRKALLEHYGDKDPDGFPTPEWTPELHLEFMEKLGIATTMLSITSPHINFGDAAAAAALAREVNEDGAEVVRKYPGRFGLLASLPLPAVERSIAEIRYSLDALQADGFTLPTNTRGVYLGDPSLDPVFTELNRRKAILVLHPNEPSAVPEHVLEKFPKPFMEFFFDTTRAVANMMVKGTLRRFPNIKIVVPHAGACLPVLADRWYGASQLMPLGESGVDVYGDLKRLYYDVAGACLPVQLAALLKLADAEHLVYGSDYPYTPEAGCIFLANAMDKTDIITERQRRAIYRDNALKLFPRLLNNR
jgi:predicted TIM-barrel fold metal-dependent hydrolase